ncbi:hypothetical protein J7L13_00505 [bacterium]|nr:hypothetical protein [bacterium]
MNLSVNLSIELKDGKYETVKKFVDSLEELCKRFAKDGTNYYFDFKAE